MGTPEQWRDAMARHGVRIVPFGPGALRAVTHLDVDDARSDPPRKPSPRARASCEERDPGRERGEIEGEMAEIRP